MAEIKVNEPAKSIFRSFSFHDRTECFRFGGLYITAMIKMARAPHAGLRQHFVLRALEGRLHLRRFTQKQNRHVNFAESVKTPPSSGPAIAAKPYMLVTMEI